MGSTSAMEIDKFPSEMEFAVYSNDDIKRLSVCKVITGLCFDALGHPLPGGPYDSRMGTYGRSMDSCPTCLNMQSCPGHFGHIELHGLVYNPFFVKLVHKILTTFCMQCHKAQITHHSQMILMLQLRLIDAGYVVEAQDLELFKSESANHNDDAMVKLETGEYVHPHIGKMLELLLKQHNNNELRGQLPSTKLSCGIRSAIIHASLQKTSNSKCIACHKPLRKVRYLSRKFVYYLTATDLKNDNPDLSTTTGQNKLVFADECRNVLRAIYEHNAKLLQLLFPILKQANVNVVCPVDIFFMDTVAVTPPKARPCNVLRNQIVEHPQTVIYRNIIECNNVLRVVMQHLKGAEQDISDEANVVYQNIRGSTPYDKFYTAWQELQNAIDALLDANVTKNVKVSDGLKQVLEKKEGLIRKHMMGKRVNYAARTVITPDPNINVEEIGIPDVFARKLSYPVPVTPWNVTELRKMVINGPNVHPGANYIQDEKGHSTLIPGDNLAKRKSMAKLLLNYPENGMKVVHRHVLNGDPLLLNRQPSLHKPSIMAHKARVLRGEKTFRLHYSNCKSYNADFDGDEMNAHYPQNEVARSEAYNLVNVANNYLVPKDGTPLGGLIQDQIISGVKLSIRGRFFNREDYQQLVYQGLDNMQGIIQLLPPTIIKPFHLWSGKQIISTLIINLIPHNCSRINLNSSAKIQSKQWNVCTPRIAACAHIKNYDELSESAVIIRQGELLAGVLDKQQYGATTYGLIHCMYELYGGEISTRLLTAFTKLFTVFLQREGFTLGVQDILVTSDADTKRQEIIKECREVGNAVAAAALDLKEVPSLDILAKQIEESYIKDTKFRVLLDRKYKSVLDRFNNEINQTCLPNGLISKFPLNNLQLMVLSGAKGSLVNTMQISSLLGQIELEGKRPPLMISGKSLPSFTSFETSPKSGGFIDGRFMTGIQPQDFFFHCMAGREGLIDTAVKTSRSGYLQRCLIKHLEGLSVSYDLTVRDSDNSVIQYLYGEDGLDILKSKFFDKKFALDFLSQNPDVILQRKELSIVKDDESLAVITKHNKKIRSWRKKNKQTISNKRRSSVFAQFSSELRNEIEVSNPNKISKKTGRRRLDESIVKLWKKADNESKEQYHKKFARYPDPLTSIYKPDRNYGSVSENIEALIDHYGRQHPDRREIIANILYLKNMKSLAAAGEPVGLLAAQSIGEPSTQMTLNTFHFAGRGEMNVTLGIPRLREILMLASANIKTPSMDIPIIPGQEKNAEKLRIKLNKVTLADILHFVNVKVKLILEPQRAYQYELYFKFLPREAYQNEYCIKPQRMLRFMNDVFFKQLFRTIVKASKNKSFNVEMDDEKKKANSHGMKEDADDGYNDENALNNERDENTKKKNKDVDDDSSDEDIVNDDDDATGIKLKSRKHDEADYDDPEEVDEIIDANEDEDDVILQEPNDNTGDDAMESSTEAILNNKMVKDYIYDKENHLWCKLTFHLSTTYNKPDISSIIRHSAKKCIVHEVSNIRRAIIYSGDNDSQLLKTDGINIAEMFTHNKILDLNRLYSNDIHNIAQTYGIEAAAQVIIKEVTNVFKVYGITVDRRHLSLIADYMTFDGSFQPLSRRGMEHSASPLQQMSFESSLQFLKNATGSGRTDGLNSPSSRLMVGLPIRNGTGAFELITQFFPQ